MQEIPYSRLSNEVVFDIVHTSLISEHCPGREYFGTEPAVSPRDSVGSVLIGNNFDQ